MFADKVAASLLEKARKSRDDLDARLLTAAATQRVADALGIQLIVTGGTAADFYAAGAAGTSAAYPPGWRASADIDLVVLRVRGSLATVNELHEALQARLGAIPERVTTNPDGSKSYSRQLTFPDSIYGIDLVGDSLNRDPNAERVITIEVEDQPVTVRGPEDTLLTYGESGWHLRHGHDWERALAVARTMRDELDLAYMRRVAKERGIEAVLDAILAQREPPPAGDTGR
ncbi:MAG: nucleotidyl transferase AbiEii/AbiGii toxin family protein [Thermoplasmatota archaeon]